jgi:hypothetical protein
VALGCPTCKGVMEVKGIRRCRYRIEYKSFLIPNPNPFCLVCDGVYHREMNIK